MPQILYLGRRWLSGPNLPAGCFDICGNSPPLGNGDKGLCQKGGEKYLLKSDLSVWYGNFDIILDHFSRISQLHLTPHMPCAAPYLVPMLIAC